MDNKSLGSLTIVSVLILVGFLFFQPTPFNSPIKPSLENSSVTLTGTNVQIIYKQPAENSHKDDSDYSLETSPYYSAIVEEPGYAPLKIDDLKYCEVDSPR